MSRADIFILNGICISWIYLPFFKNQFSCPILTLVAHSSQRTPQMTPEWSLCLSGCSCVGLFCRTKLPLTTTQTKRGCSFSPDVDASPASCVFCCSKPLNKVAFPTKMLIWNCCLVIRVILQSWICQVSFDMEEIQFLSPWQAPLCYRLEVWKYWFPWWPSDEGCFASVFRPIYFFGKPQKLGISIHCPTEDLCCGADNLGPSQIQLQHCYGLGWPWEHNGPNGPLYPGELHAELPFELSKILFIFKQPDFPCPIAAPPMAPTRTSKQKMGHQLQHSPRAGSFYAVDFWVYK